MATIRAYASLEITDFWMRNYVEKKMILVDLRVDSFV
jgi:hypothetical protein